MLRNDKFYKEKKLREFCTTNRYCDIAEREKTWYKRKVPKIVVDETVAPKKYLNVLRYMAGKMVVRSLTEWSWKDYINKSVEYIKNCDNYDETIRIRDDWTTDSVEEIDIEFFNKYFKYHKDCISTYDGMYERLKYGVYNCFTYTSLQMTFPKKWFKLVAVDKDFVIRTNSGFNKHDNKNYLFGLYYGNPNNHDLDWRFRKYGVNKKAKKLNRVKDERFMDNEAKEWCKHRKYYYNEIYVSDEEFVEERTNWLEYNQNKSL